MSRKIIISLFLLLISLSVVSSTLYAQTMENKKNESVTLNLTPSSVDINTFYNGTDVNVEGKVPADAELLIRLSGSPHEVSLKKKGKVGGFLWMNVGEVTFENVPPVDLLYTSKGLGKIAQDEENGRWASLGLGFDAIKNQADILPATTDKEILFKEFMKLKKHEALYKLEPDAIRFTNAEDGMKTYSAAIHIPPKLKSGTYQVDVYAVEGNQIAAQTSRQLNLKQIGFPAFLSSMAFGRSLVYGIMAVVIAVFAGLGTSMVFSSKGGAH